MARTFALLALVLALAVYVSAYGTVFVNNVVPVKTGTTSIPVVTGGTPHGTDIAPAFC